jgi:hypothetical protein
MASMDITVKLTIEGQEGIEAMKAAVNLALAMERDYRDDNRPGRIVDCLATVAEHLVATACDPECKRLDLPPSANGDLLGRTRRMNEE